MTYIFACYQSERASHEVWRVNEEDPTYFSIDKDCTIIWKPKLVLQEPHKSYAFHLRKEPQIEYERLYPIRWFMICIVKAKDIRKIHNKTGQARFDYCIDKVKNLQRSFMTFVQCWYRYRQKNQEILSLCPPEIIEWICKLGLGKINYL